MYEANSMHFLLDGIKRMHVLYCHTGMTGKAAWTSSFKTDAQDDISGSDVHSRLLYEINQCNIELIFHKLPLEESVLD